MLCVELFDYQCRMEWKGYEGMAGSLTTGTATVLRGSHSSVAEDFSLKDVAPCRLVTTSAKIAMLSSQDSGSPRRLACL
jgi:hypothetical protein